MGLKLHIIVVAFRRPMELERLVYDFRLQTCRDWSMNIIHDGEPPEEMVRYFKNLKDDRVKFDYTKVVNGLWGHPNRRMMLQELKGEPGDYVLITNDDNQYVPVFVEYMLKLSAKNVGMVLCDAIHNYWRYDILRTRVQIGGIDMGSFIVRYDIAKAVGFNHVDQIVADGIYACECSNECIRRELEVRVLCKPLFIHN